MSTCKECEFCFPNEKGFVCAGEHYGDSITDTLDQVKGCCSEGFDAFSLKRGNAILPINPPRTLGQMKIDGRTKIKLIDMAGKELVIKASEAKKHFLDMVLIKVRYEEMWEDEYWFEGEFRKNVV